MALNWPKITTLVGGFIGSLDPSVLTVRKIRELLAKELGIEASEFSADERERIKSIVDTEWCAFEKKNQTADTAGDENVSPKKRNKAETAVEERPAKKAREIDTHKPQPKAKPAQGKPAPKPSVAKGKKRATADSASDFESEDEDEPVLVSNRKAAKRETKETKKMPSKAATEKYASEKEKKIEELKKFVGKCGVRKVWAKELKDLTEAEQIKKLRTILSDMGMEGEPTLKKCEKIKSRIEREKDISSLDTSNIIEVRTPRRAASHTLQRMKEQMERAEQIKREIASNEEDGMEDSEDDDDDNDDDDEDEAGEEEDVGDGDKNDQADDEHDDEFVTKGDNDDDVEERQAAESTNVRSRRIRGSRRVEDDGSD